MLSQAEFLDLLLRHKILYDTGVDGIYGRSGAFEDVVARLGTSISAHGARENAPVIHFPAGMNRAEFEKSGYMKNFPNLVGTVHCFCGDEAEHRALMATINSGGDWTAKQPSSDVVLIPAACYPLYPLVARMGQLPAEGRVFDILSHCFRREPSRDPARMQMFRQREYVRFGSAEQVLEFLKNWKERGQALALALGLDPVIEVANDPFFGRTGKMLAVNQRDQALKFELLLGVTQEKPTACMSFNYHLDNFGKAWGIQGTGQTISHTGCVGFGLERLTLALFSKHGLDVSVWPGKVRAVLWG
jgi:seryl-tRNA synthetase